MMVKRAEDVQQKQSNDGLRQYHAQSGAEDLKMILVLARWKLRTQWLGDRPLLPLRCR